MTMGKLSSLTLLAAVAVLVPLAPFVRRADAQARFDLEGPKIDARVTHEGKTLPIASVPNLAVGDRLWLRPNFPETQSVHYLMIVAFLRGTTNPPPEDWFVRIETWSKKIREEGAEVVVPAEAQQVLVFLAPVTGGDFATLKSAVRGRPGVFVRASQDLNEAGFEQARIEKYLSSMKQVPPGDAKGLLDHSNLLARTLALRPNPECFKRDVDQQITCLTQTGTQTLLDDGHGQTIAAALTTGPGSDFITAASYTQAAGAGTYSAYVGAVVDLGRILSALHTAQFQYIPAIAFPQGEALNLRLNTPPSFHNPKSVIVIGLPSVQKTVTPPLRTTDDRHVTCLLEPHVAIPVEGAPLVFSTGFAHDLVLHLNTAAPQDLPVTADAYQGGLVLAPTNQRRPLEDPGPPKAAGAAATDVVVKAPATQITGTVRGFWGFDAFTGPTVPLQQVPGVGWKVLSGEPLIVGHKQDRLTLTSTGSACVQTITFDAASGAEGKASVKAAGESAQANAIEVDLPLVSAAPGSLQLAIHQFGVAAVTPLDVRTYSEPARLDAMTIHAGDRGAVLTGQHLDQVRQVRVNDVRFAASGMAGANATTGPDASDRLVLGLAADASAPNLKAGEKVTAHVLLADGRDLDLPVTVAAARPVLMLRSRSVPHNVASPIKLVSKDDLRVDEPITLILKSSAAISRTEELEVAQDAGTDADGAASRLTFASGALVLQDSHTLRATIDPLKMFGASIFGPIRVRAVLQGSDPGDWIPVANLVRLPTVSMLTCPSEAVKPCMLTGSSLFLIDAIAPSASLDGVLTDPTTVPEDFTDMTLAVPHPVGGILYLRPRDDRSAIATLSLPVQTEPTTTRPAAHPPAPSGAATAATTTATTTAVR